MNILCKQYICNISHTIEAVFSVVQLMSMLILGLHPANDRRRYFVESSLIDWVQA